MFCQEICVKLFSQDHSNKVKGETFSLLTQVCKPQILCGHSFFWSNNYYMMIFKLRSFCFQIKVWDCFQASLSKVHFSLFHCNGWCCKMCFYACIPSGGWMPEGHGGGGGCNHNHTTRQKNTLWATNLHPNHEPLLPQVPQEHLSYWAWGQRLSRSGMKSHNAGMEPAPHTHNTMQELNKIIVQ